MPKNEQTAFDSKTLNYASDGTGRDTYILRRKLYLIPKIYTKDHKVTVHELIARLPLKPFIIIPMEQEEINTLYEGGLSRFPSHILRSKFQNNLRCYGKTPNWYIRKPDYFQMSQNGMHQLERPKSALLARKQKNLCDKLSQPK